MQALKPLPGFRKALAPTAKDDASRVPYRLEFSSESQMPIYLIDAERCDHVA
jgi:hypothetical protein